MANGRPNEYDAVSIPSFMSMSEKTISSHPSQDFVQVTCSMVHNLNCEDENDMNIRPTQNSMYNAPTPPVSEAGEVDVYLSHDTINSDGLNYPIFSPQLMIIYESGDLNCAMHFLIESLHAPFSSNAVATVFVEESIRDEVLDRIVDNMQPLTEQVARHPNYMATLEMLDKLNIKTIRARAENVPPQLATPIVVCDIQHSLLGSGPSGVVCLHTFRSVKEIVELSRKENLSFSTVCIWNEFVECIYQIVASLNCPTFFINCSNVSLEPICTSLAANRIFACVVDGYHYETIQFNKQMRIVVFPVGAHLAQKAVQEPITSFPISFLNE